MTCVYCDHDLGGPTARAAFDPWLGRLWRVCPGCRRWNVVPLEERWEALESYERLCRDRGRVRLRTEHLDLVDAGGEQLVRVGRAPRPELARWRYGPLLPAVVGNGPLEWLRRLLLALPSSPFGYAAGHGQLMAGTQMLERRWFASPFLEDAPTLTAAFLHVPLADECGACHAPLWLAPWSFQELRLAGDAGGARLVASCGVCGRETGVPAAAARPALRLGLSVVNRRLRAEPVVSEAAAELEEVGGPEGLLAGLAEEGSTLGALSPPERLALGMALDEQSEAELLEAEWRVGEEIAALVDAELTRVDGFEEFRSRVLRGD